VSNWNRDNRIEPTRKAAAFAQALLTPRTRWVVCVSGSERDILARAAMTNQPISRSAFCFRGRALAMLGRLIDERRLCRHFGGRDRSPPGRSPTQRSSLKRPNRALKALSSCSKAMIHARDEQACSTRLPDPDHDRGYKLACVARPRSVSRRPCTPRRSATRPAGS